MTKSFVIGSRGSKLALVQAGWVKSQLLLLNPAADLRIQIIKTTGDVKADPLSVIGGKGVFTKELEDALLDRRIDLAVHSLKDLPTVIPQALALAVICEREDPNDALLVTGGVSLRSLESLPERAVVGTSSPRRAAQLQFLRPDLVIRDVRGNVDTRLRKLDEGDYDALVLALAGLKRLGSEGRVSCVISVREMVPAVGQGAIGVQTRDDDSAVQTIVAPLNHPETRLACEAERSLLRALGGGCQLPIAAHAVISDQRLSLDALVATRDGSQVVRDQISGPPQDAEQLGADLAERLMKNGAQELLNS
jgi:hydroxymethylbilane synthase